MGFSRVFSFSGNRGASAYQRITKVVVDPDAQNLTFTVAVYADFAARLNETPLGEDTTVIPMYRLTNNFMRAMYKLILDYEAGAYYLADNDETPPILTALSINDPVANPMPPP